MFGGHEKGAEDDIFRPKRIGPAQTVFCEWSLRQIEAIRFP